MFCPGSVSRRGGAASNRKGWNGGKGAVFSISSGGGRGYDARLLMSDPISSPTDAIPGPSAAAAAGTAASLLIELETILEPLDLARLFPVAQPLEVELGCGDASFLLEYARQNPGRNFLGVERLLGRLQKLDRKGRRLGLRNLRGVRMESAYLLRYLVPPGAAEAVHIYFPDPWPKLKHRRHRLINEGFPALVRGALRSRGTVFLRTDDLDYFQQMREVFGGAGEFEEVPTPPELAAVRTDFEQFFNAQGIPTQHAAYRRRD